MDVESIGRFENLQTGNASRGTQFTWAFDDGENNGFPDDGIPDDDPIYGITNNDGQVTWTIRYDLGINICENCGEILYDEYFHLEDIVKQMPPVMDRFFSDEGHRTCNQCGAVMEAPAKG